MELKEFLKFLISHHYPNQYNRCYKIGKLHVCARCLGLYPFLILLVILQFYIPFPKEYEDIILYALPIPAFVDWTLGFLFGVKGYNWIRTTTGILLGISLSRLIWLHIKDPFNKTSLRGFILYFLVISVIVTIKFYIKMIKHYDDFNRY